MVGGGGVEMVAAPTAAPAEIDVNKLMVVQLRVELKKRGHSTFGNKGAMQEHLKEAIVMNVPVSELAGNEEGHCDDCMMGVDVMARWELLTPCGDPIPEPDNEDGSLWLPTEMNATVNPKYGFIKMFHHIPSTGTTEKMRYVHPKGQSIHCVRNQKKQKQSEMPLSPNC